MYNRYLGAADAPYVPTEPSGGETPPQSRPASGEAGPPPPPPPGNSGSPMDRIQQLLGLGGGKKDGGGEGTPLRRLLARFHLEDVDTGDLLLLILLFFLLEEKADDELLIALGLLLIL